MQSDIFENIFFYKQNFSSVLLKSISMAYFEYFRV